MAIVFALSAAFAWGCADFIGGVASRRLGVLTVLLLVEVGGLIVIGLITLVLQPEMLPLDLSLMALGSGLVGVCGLGLFYRALAVGTMSVVAPITATGAVLPVAIGVIGGERPATLQWVGLAVIIVGVVLASREQSSVEADAEAQRTSVVLALLAALCFGAFFALSSVPAEESVPWTVMFIRLAPVPFLAVLWWQRGSELPSRKLGLGLMAAGCIDLAATSLIALANAAGDLSIVSVVASMYPVTTVMLAAVILHERLLPSQYVGVVLAFLGIGAVAGG